MSIRRYVIALVALPLLVLMFPISSASAQTDGLRFRSVDTAKYPHIQAEVFAYDPRFAGTTFDSGSFTLKENGAKVENLNVKRISDNPMTVVLAIDTSGSMQGAPLADAKQAAKGFVASVTAPNKIAIVGFNTIPSLIIAPTSDKKALNDAIDRLEAEGDTALYDAMVTGVDLASSSDSNQKNMVILTDGQDNKSTQSLEAAIAKATTAGMTVFGIGLVSDDFNAATLETIAEQTGGKSVSTSDSSALKDVYASLARELKEQYKISYVSQAGKDAKELTLALTVSQGALVLHESKVIANPTFKQTGTVQPNRIDLTPVAKVAGSPAWYWAVLLTVFLAVFMFVFGILAAVSLSRRLLSKQLAFYEERTIGRTEENKVRKKSSSERKVLEEALRMTKLAADKRGFNSMIQLLLIQADIPLKPAEFILFHFVAVVALGLLSFAFFGNLLVTVIVIAAATIVPLLYVDYLINRRKRLFHDQLPDILSLLSGSLRTGYGLLQALSLVADEVAAPASTEIKKALAETNLGLPLEEALDSMAARIGSEHLNWAIMAIKIHNEVGGNLATLLDTLASSVRERDRISRQIKVLTSEGRLSAIILFVLPILLAAFFYFANRQYISLLTATRAGQIMIAVALALMGVGAVWLKKIISIET